jgi:small subunit ribosomal protein S19
MTFLMNSSYSKIYSIDSNILKHLNSSGKETTSLQTWSRASQITSDFVGLRLKIHNGKEFFPIVITNEMVGHKLGEFALTRARYVFKKKKKKK